MSTGTLDIGTFASMKQVLPDGPGLAIARASTAPTVESGTGPGTTKDAATVNAVAAQLPRPQFVLGVFYDLGAMHEAVACLLNRDLHYSELLLVARTSATPASAPADIKTCHLDLETRNEDLLRHAIAAEPPFAPLWESMRASSTRSDSSYPRIYTQLIHHLATGADVLIIRVHREEQQRRTARALLDCRCDILLTHEVSIRCD